MSFDVFDKGTPAFDGKAIRRQVTVCFSADKTGPKMDLLLYLPAGARKTCSAAAEPELFRKLEHGGRPGREVGRNLGTREEESACQPGARSFGKMDVVRLLEAGFGFATVYYGDIDPDFAGRLAARRAGSVSEAWAD